MKKSFTLVELIITVSIISVISTALFLTINKWLATSRDASRKISINQIQKVLEIGYIEKTHYPIPDRDEQKRIYIGSIGETELFYQGVINKGVMQSLDSMNKAPLDPLKEEQNIIYGISADKQSYQISMTEENPKWAYQQHKALLAGNYECYLFYQTGSEIYITNPPSLIYNYSGYNNSEHNIQDEQVYFIAENSKNIAYALENEEVNFDNTKQIFNNGVCDGPYIDNLNIKDNEKIGNKLIKSIKKKGIITKSLDLIKTIKYYSKINDIFGNFNEELKYGDKFGASVANIGDLNKDGYNDIAVGTYSKNFEETNDGIIYIIFLDGEGQTKSFTRISLPEEIDANDMFGMSVANIGDLDKDGNNDILVGAPQDDDGGTDKGAVYIIYLNKNGSMKKYKKISDNTNNFQGQLNDDDNFGYSVSNIGDLDNDGTPEFAVGAARDDDGGLNQGAIYIFFPDKEGNIIKWQKISENEGNFNANLYFGDRFGNSINHIGDINKDGIEDIGVGAYECNDGGIDKGCVYILILNTNGTIKSYNKISDTSGNFSGVLTGDDMFGSAITGLGDLDNDGFLDIAITSIGDDEDGEDSGSLYILYLDQDANVKEYKKIGNKQGNFNSRLDERDYFGISTANLGDLDHDGLIDLLVGAIGDDDGGTNHGAIYILFLEL